MRLSCSFHSYQRGSVVQPDRKNVHADGNDFGILHRAIKYTIECGIHEQRLYTCDCLAFAEIFSSAMLCEALTGISKMLRR